MPERIGLVEDFGRRWRLASAGVSVNRRFAQSHPAAVDELVRQYLLAIRMVVDDAARLAEEAADILGDERDWSRVAREFIAANTWPVDGGLEPEVLRDTIAFHIRAGNLSGRIDASHLIDRSFLDRTLSRTPALSSPSTQ
jgi:ABC-type nitrate/sulfonate/bicarbonate transport system substrate-binding protein